MMEPARQHSVRVMLAQSEIKSDINASNLGLLLGGGLLGGLISAVQNADRAKKAEELITPVRTAIIDMDVDALALNTARSSMSKVSWLEKAPITYGKDSSPVGRSDFLDADAAPHVAFIEYTYDLSPNFDAIRVVALTQFADKALPAKKRNAKPTDRVHQKHLAYSRAVTSIVTLPNASPDDKEANAARWAADDGLLAERALDQAFKRLAALAPQSLALTDADVKAMKDKTRPKAQYEALKGRLIETSENGDTLFWANQFVSVQSLR